MSEPKVTVDYMNAAFDTQGVSPEGVQFEPWAASLETLLKNAARGYARLEFEHEPATFQAEQDRSAP
jgi:hypothetical protein